MTPRVTTQSLSRQIIDGLQRSSRRLADVQEVVTSGKRISRLSDDPIGATRVLDLRSFNTSLDQYNKNINNALPFLEQSETMFAGVAEVLQRARELTVAMANDTNSTQDRQQTAVEIRQLFLQLLSLGNSKVEGRYLFGGFKNGAAPFAEGAGVVTYSGDGGEIAIQANASSTLGLNLPGNKVFQGASVAGGTGLFDALLDLENVLKGTNTGVNTLSLAVNLNSTTVPASVPAFPAGPDDTPANWSASSHFSTAVTVFDSLGEAHNLTFLLRNSAANTWEYRVLANRKELDAGAPTSTDLRQVGSGTLVFSAGALNLPASTINNITLTGLVNGASNITITGSNQNFTGSTQLAQSSSVLTLSQTNTNGFNPQLGRLDAALEQVLNFRAEIGARLNTAEAAKEGLELMKTRTLKLSSEIEDADVLQVYSDFTRLRQGFEAALLSASRVIQPSLLDFLR
jgi:flagellin-like hook-associated protein FlgL